MVLIPQTAQDAANYWASSVRYGNYMTVVAFTILYYDYLLTVLDEFQCFWTTPRLSLASVLYVAVRYYGLVGPIPVFLESFGNISEQRYRELLELIHHRAHVHLVSCRQLQTYHQIFAISSQGIIAIALVIRTYALYERSKKILMLLIITYLGGAVVCFVAVFTTNIPVHTPSSLPFTYTGCDLSLSSEQGIHFAIAWGAMLWYDSTIFVLTIAQALRTRFHYPGGILEIMFRDGTIFYGIMVTANVWNIVTFLRTPSGSPSKGTNTTLTNVLSTTLTARIILNLRNPTLYDPSPTNACTLIRKYKGEERKASTPIQAGIIVMQTIEIYEDNHQKRVVDV